MRDDVRAARREARQLIGQALVVPLLAALMWVASPGGWDPVWYGAGWLVVIPPAAAAAVYLFGLAWMIRIYRTSHLEPETSSWRYRDF
jgi:hypothetical protein